MSLSRRAFVSSSIIGLSGLIDLSSIRSVTAKDSEADFPIVDSHTHFYDPTRPEGVPWPAKNDALLYRQVLPTEFKSVTKPFGVTGTVIIEASPWLEDNQWLLDLAAKDPFILGVVGNLTPGTEPFAAQLARFKKNPIFRGIRINSQAVKNGLDRPDFLADLRKMIDADLELDVNGGPEMLVLVEKLASELPELRIAVNHLSNMRIDGKEPQPGWLADLKRMSKHPRVFLKVSSLMGSARIDGGKAPEDSSFYRPVLKAVWDVMGEDRLIYGSDWPVSDNAGPYSKVFQIVADFFRDQGVVAMKKFFALNSQAAYRWKNRG